MFHSCRGTTSGGGQQQRNSPNSSQIALRTSFFPSRDTSTTNIHSTGAPPQQLAQLPSPKVYTQVTFPPLHLVPRARLGYNPGPTGHSPRHHALPRAHDLVRAHRNLPSQHNWRLYNRCPGMLAPRLKLHARALLPKAPSTRRKQDH
jgi:hypothetical protein